MSYGYKTILKLEEKEYALEAFSYQFEKDINEDGKVTSAIKSSGYIHISLSAVPTKELLAWATESRSYKDGSIHVINTSDESSIPQEELFFEYAACIDMKLSYENDHSGYFSTILTISAENLRLGNSSWINKKWQ